MSLPILYYDNIYDKIFKKINGIYNFVLKNLIYIHK